MLDGGNQHCAHDAELQQVLGGAIDIGTEVEHMAVALDGRQDRCDRGAVDARQRS